MNEREELKPNVALERFGHWADKPAGRKRKILESISNWSVLSGLWSGFSMKLDNDIEDKSINAICENCINMSNDEKSKKRLTLEQNIYI